MTRQTTPDMLAEPITSDDAGLAPMFGQEPGQEPNALALVSQASRMLDAANTIDEIVAFINYAETARQWAKRIKAGLESQNAAAEYKLRAERKAGQVLRQMEKSKGRQGQLTGRDSSGGNIMLPPINLDNVPTYAELGIEKIQASRWQTIYDLPAMEFEGYIKGYSDAQEELTSAGALRLAKQLKQEEAKNADPYPASLADKQPILIVGKAEELTDIADETVNVIVTSPPYNMGSNHWDMGYRGSREAGIGYEDNLPEQEYQDWQRVVLRELYRVATPGASLFYNHKVRIKNGQAILPTDWVRKSGWILRQVIVWDRGSTHNHETRLFWPHDEWVLWLTKGKPDLKHSINMPSVWQFHGPVAGTWHPAPFAEELPRRCLQAVGFPGCVVLDPFAGSCTTVKVALEMGYDAIGVDVSAEYLQKARLEHGW